MGSQMTKPIYLYNIYYQLWELRIRKNFFAYYFWCHVKQYSFSRLLIPNTGEMLSDSMLSSIKGLVCLCLSEYWVQHGNKEPLCYWYPLTVTKANHENLLLLTCNSQHKTNPCSLFGFSLLCNGVGFICLLITFISPLHCRDDMHGFM